MNFIRPKDTEIPSSKPKQINGLEIKRDQVTNGNTDELIKLRKALDFLTSHLPGASELADIANEKTLALSSNRPADPEEVLLEGEKINSESERSQAALDAFIEKRLNNLEVGRLYERYIGYLYEQGGWSVTFKGIVEGFNDLGRDLICVKDRDHLIVQAKCWSRNKQIHEKHVYQLHSSTLHYRMSLRKSLKAAFGKKKARQMMQNTNISSVICTTNDLSETAHEVVNFLGREMKHQKKELRKDYPMIKCNVGMHDHQKLYHLPFDPQYDTIIIGNMEGECYVKTVVEAEGLGFRRVGT